MKNYNTWEVQTVVPFFFFWEGGFLILKFRLVLSTNWIFRTPDPTHLLLFFLFFLLERHYTPNNKVACYQIVWPLPFIFFLYIFFGSIVSSLLFSSLFFLCATWPTRNIPSIFLVLLCTTWCYYLLFFFSHLPIVLPYIRGREEQKN